MINLAIVTVYHDVTRLTRKKITRYNKCRANKHLYTKKFRIIKCIYVNDNSNNCYRYIPVAAAFIISRGSVPSSYY